MSELAAALTIIIAAIITILMGFFLIPRLKRMKLGQTILEIGPRWHKDKEGTPTMGGLMFVIGIIIAVICGYFLTNISVTKNLSNFTAHHQQVLISGVLMALGFGLIGFIDDFIIVKNKTNQGLTERQKLVGQFIVAIGYVVALYMIGEKSTIVWLPFIGQWNMGILYYPAIVLGIVYIVNVVNFTDGIDGLCTSVTLVSAIGFFIVAHMLEYNLIKVLAAALIGGCIGFLFGNLYPAKIFMGDTGSFFLGGMIVALAFGMGMPLILIFFGFVYIVEGISVIIQTLYFKYTRRKTGEGKRFFKMTPIHHHFEMSGWSEKKIVIVFASVQLIMVVIGILAVNRM